MNRIIGIAAGFALATVAATGLTRERGEALLDEAAYRTDLEEIIVHGQAPRWRDSMTAEDLRPEDIEFFEPDPDARLEWLPTYTREERENYQKVRDRKNETPELKLFEIRF